MVFPRQLPVDVIIKTEIVIIFGIADIHANQSAAFVVTIINLQGLAVNLHRINE